MGILLNKKIAFIVTTPMTISSFLIFQIKYLSKYFQISIFTNLKYNSELLNNLPNSIKIYSIPIERKISLIADIRSFLILRKILKKNKYDIIHSITPKAGIISAISGFLIGTKIRVHTFTGQVWATKSGIMKFFLSSIDKIIVLLNTFILIDSKSQENFLKINKILFKSKHKVLCQGSVGGVDLSIFKPNPVLRKKTRSQIGIPNSTFIISYIGRLNKDKGIIDLIEAFILLKKKNLKIELMIVGDDEDCLKNKIIQKLNNFSKYVHFIPYNPQPEKFFSSIDLLILPSYREGFGTTVIEAAACGIPTIATRIYGLSDAVVDGETGILFTLKNYNELASKIEYLFKNQKLLKQYGQNALKRTQKFFSQEVLASALLDFYRSQLAQSDQLLK